MFLFEFALYISVSVGGLLLFKCLPTQLYRKYNYNIIIFKIELNLNFDALI